MYLSSTHSRKGCANILQSACDGRVQRKWKSAMEECHGNEALLWPECCAQLDRRKTGPAVVGNHYYWWFFSHSCTLQTEFILAIALSSELQPGMDSIMYSYYNNYCYYNVNKTLILSCSSHVIYRYHLTGKWIGMPNGGMDNGMHSWWHHCVSEFFVPSFRSDLKNRHWC